MYMSKSISLNLEMLIESSRNGPRKSDSELDAAADAMGVGQEWKNWKKTKKKEEKSRISQNSRNHTNRQNRTFRSFLSNFSIPFSSYIKWRGGKTRKNIPRKKRKPTRARKPTRKRKPTRAKKHTQKRKNR